MRFILMVCLCATSPLAGLAAEAPKQGAPKPSAEAPPPPPPASGTPASSASEPETGLEPEITITTRGELTYEEYRVHGKLYMIKVTPKHGKPYYLIDHEGSGQLRRSDLEPTISIPNWVIKTW